MSMGTAIALVRQGVLETLILAGPLLLLGMAVGLIVAIFQATTSIQEQTLSFVPKIAAILLGLILFGKFLMDSLVGYTQRLFSMISNI
ncbi:MAG: flagellar biosynthesis protein FliQ [Spirochaetia bacterium]|jgi:flagellar biosynthetic protein FliQ